MTQNEIKRVRTNQIRAKHNAFIKLADGKEMKCVICGCPHEEALSFGHLNDGGKEHRKKITTPIFHWVNKTPIDEVKSKLQIECVYCNLYKAWNRHYPPPDKRPKW